eukprot:TRINITY_DN12075_c0_g1_i1.p1 TRINITY_DN12075_c0_g1~~TRINITY_DN12075_c0_g1_i1.p1  ORF type:complete len:711 (-),score=179.74 TRINITY_DN12075_c0_g1_i1:154-2286(-)
MSTIGIDFGANSISVSIYNESNQSEILHFNGSDLSIENAICFKDGTRIFGERAMKFIYKNSSCGFFEFLKLNPFYSQKCPSSNEIDVNKIKLLCNDVSHFKKDNEYYLEEIGAMWIRYIVAQAQKQIGNTVSQIIFSYPAGVSRKYLTFLRDCSILGNCRNLGFRSNLSSLASLYSYRYSSSVKPGYTLLIVDSGHIQTSIGLYQYSQRWNALAVDIIPLGGSTFSDSLYDLICEKDQSAEGSVLKKALGRLKKELSTNDQAIYDFEVDGEDFEIVINRSEYETRLSEQILKISESIDKISVIPAFANITDVIVSGGNGRTPIIRSLLEDKLQPIKINLSFAGDDVFALGLLTPTPTNDVFVGGLALQNMESSEMQLVQQPFSSTEFEDMSFDLRIPNSANRLLEMHSEGHLILSDFESTSGKIILNQRNGKISGFDSVTYQEIPLLISNLPSAERETLFKKLNDFDRLDADYEKFGEKKNLAEAFILEIQSDLQHLQKLTHEFENELHTIDSIDQIEEKMQYLKQEVQNCFFKHSPKTANRPRTSTARAKSSDDKLNVPTAGKVQSQPISQQQPQQPQMQPQSQQSRRKKGKSSSTASRGYSDQPNFSMQQPPEYASQNYYTPPEFYGSPQRNPSQQYLEPQFQQQPQFPQQLIGPQRFSKKSDQPMRKLNNPNANRYGLPKSKKSKFPKPATNPSYAEKQKPWWDSFF